MTIRMAGQVGLYRLAWRSVICVPDIVIRSPVALIPGWMLSADLSL